MRYFGGKTRIAKYIAKIINNLDATAYYEPFCGGLSVSRLIAKRPAYLSDVCEPLITLYKALQDGWVPPDAVSEEDYRLLQALKNPSNPMTAFAGFGCSFAAKFFGGYARDGGAGRNYAEEAKRSLASKLNDLMDVEFSCQSYSDLIPTGGSVIYCDPPYINTTAYSAAPKWDAARFWAQVTAWSRTCVVLVSEYVAPQGFSTIREFTTRTSICDGSGSVRVEKVFVHESQAHIFLPLTEVSQNSELL